jgi:hypothetical protein
LVPKKEDVKPPKIKESLLSDPAGAVVPEGAKCLRASCKAIYPAAEETCKFHNGGVMRSFNLLVEPVFHEGSKFWSCCPDHGRVLEYGLCFLISN